MPTIEDYQKIAESNSMGTIDKQDIDSTSAEAVIAVYNKLENPGFKEKLMEMAPWAAVMISIRMLNQ